MELVAKQTPTVRESQIIHPAYAALNIFVLLLAIGASGISSAQSAQPSGVTLEQEFTDPLTALPQIVARDSYSPATYGTHVQTNQVILRPIIPSIPPNTLLPVTQLIRPTFSLLTVPSARGGSRTEFGDLPMFDLVLVPWFQKERTGLLVALSPAINDPTTAVQALDQIQDLLLRLGQRLEIGAIRDNEGTLRLVIPQPTWADFLRLAFDEIRACGATSVQVMCRMRALINDVKAALPQERHQELEFHRERLNLTIARAFVLDEQMKLEASVEDRQGLGVPLERNSP